MEQPRPRSGDVTIQRDALARRMYRRSLVTGEITLPAVPDMIDEYVSMCETLFAGVGRAFTAEQLGQVRSVFQGQLAEAYANSPRSNIVITFDAPVGTVLNYHVRAEWWSVEGAYENWTSTRKPPLFGTEPDARVWNLAIEAPDAATYPVLDIGGGTGRNTLALARRGHPVEVVEMTPKFRRDHPRRARVLSRSGQGRGAADRIETHCALAGARRLLPVCAPGETRGVEPDLAGRSSCCERSRLPLCR